MNGAEAFPTNRTVAVAGSSVGRADSCGLCVHHHQAVDPLAAHPPPEASRIGELGADYDPRR